jgi:hypothetical protein
LVQKVKSEKFLISLLIRSVTIDRSASVLEALSQPTISGQGFPMQRFMDKWGLWIALFVIGGIISYGIISGLMKPEESNGKTPVNKLPAKSAFQ